MQGMEREREREREGERESREGAAPNDKCRRAQAVEKARLQRGEREERKMANTGRHNVSEQRAG